MKQKKSGNEETDKKVPKDRVKCTFCSYTSVEKYRMKRHMRVHTGEKPYMCGMCDQSFTQKSSLKEHLWKHTALRSSHKCPHCNAIFNQPADVKAHINHMHTACEEMACTVCPEVFTDRYSLLQHQKSHDNMFRYQCLECAFSSRDKNKLIIHMSIHNKKNPLRCSACRSTFKNKNNLLHHLFQKHDVSTFGDDYLPTPAETKTATSEGDAPPKKMTNQQELEQEYQIMDEHGNTIHLSEADAEAIHSAMQQSAGEGTLQIIHNEEGTMTVTVLTVSHNLDGSIQNIEQNMGVLADSSAMEQQLLAAGESLVEGGESENTLTEEAAEGQGDNQAGEQAGEPEENTDQVEATDHSILNTSLE